MLVTILASLSLVATGNAQAIRRGPLDDAPGTIECAYMVDFPPGTDGLLSIKSHFEALNVKYNVRVVSNTKYSNFVSFSIEESCDVDTHVAPIPGAVTFSNIRAIDRPAPVSVAPSEVQEHPELIHSITGVNQARNELGLTGKGLNIAVIDSGVHYLHPALGGGFGPGFKVSKGWDFVGDNFGTNYIPIPDADPMDNCSAESHGTHVAGIIGADARNITAAGWIPNTPFTGVAPDANIFAYRVFGCTGSTSGDVEAAAIYRAAADGAHVINLSIGGGPSYYDSPEAIAAEIVGKAGHFVVASCGNDGAAGPFATGNPGNSRGGLGVASFDNVAIPAPYLTVDDVKYTYAVGSANGAFTEGQVLDIVVNDLTADDNDVQNDGTAAVPTIDCKGKAILIRWGATSFGGSAARCGYAYKAGASACILYNNGVAPVAIAGSPNVPSMIIPNAAGKAIITAIKAGKKPLVVVSFKTIMTPLPTAATLSDFSSPGLDNELWFKPDLGGVGGQVMSTLSPVGAKDQGFHENYGVMSGTSMASPYVAGVAALMIQAKGNLTFEEFRGYLQNTASLKPLYGRNMINSPAYQGAGLVNAYWAASSKTLVLPSAIALNDTVNIRANYTITIKNGYNFSMNYYLNNNNAATANPVLPGDDFTQDASSTTFIDKTPAELKFDGEDGYGQEAWDFKLVRVAPGQSVEVTFVITPPSIDATLYSIYGGYISVVNDYDDNIITVPYAGIAGDWKNRPIWSRNSASLASRWLAPTVGHAVNSAGTGIYKDDSYTPLQPKSVINGTIGSYLLAIPAATSRFAIIQAIYQGADLTPMLKAGFAGRQVILRYSDLTNGGTKPGYFTLLQRSTFKTGQSVRGNNRYKWNGIGYNKNFALAKLPPGPYRISFAALKNFGDENKNEDFDEVLSPLFTLVY
ncbi:UNVERIFIED_CONTAM: hypothetical protein HDU68_006931 [Siphonaria sp. JEL0065]|nr:hypothetical protein HDU68_006931 [Siphonaria sp. JEL0065]